MAIEPGIAEAVTAFQADGNYKTFEIDASLVFGPGFPAFEGHFPGNPILPGIIQLASVRVLASMFLRRSLVSSSLSNIKFRDMIRPGQEVRVRLYGAEKGQGWKVRFEINGVHNPVSSGSMLLMPHGVEHGNSDAAPFPQET